jgi:hypothetical protein
MDLLKSHPLAPFLAALSLIAVEGAFAEMTTNRGSRLQNEAAAITETSAQDKDKKDNKDKKVDRKGGSEEAKARSSARKNVGPGAERPVTGARVECSIKRAPAGLAGVAEASGLAASRRTPGILWSHGDSYAGEPYLYAFAANGAPKGRVRLQGVRVADWEAVAVGPCGGSSCVFIGDIGDNQGARKSIAIYGLPEPLPTDQVASPTQTFHATFPDGPHDAEAMFVSSSGGIFIVTKGENGPIALYRFGSSPKAGGATVLQKVAVLQTRAIARNQWVTDASASRDGKWIALRTHGAVYFYDAERLMKGDLKAPMRFDVTSLREPQGEGIALGADGTLFLAGEGGGRGAAGTLGSGVCKLPIAGSVETP